jgi:hypothetical protein
VLYLFFALGFLIVVLILGNLGHNIDYNEFWRGTSIALAFDDILMQPIIAI